jgi:hypothetical protein
VQFDRHGNRIRHQAKALPDSEHARRAVGEVAVPSGGCAGPSNVKAGGRACPYRFRCAGCDHFRTDASYLPDLTAYLDDLLRTRERLAAAAGLDEWARADAMPSDEEITRIRRLLSRIKATLDDLTSQERAEADQAAAAVRRHRAISPGMPASASRSSASIPGSPHDQQNAGLRLQLGERDGELSAARAANRELVARLSTPPRP